MKKLIFALCILLLTVFVTDAQNPTWILPNDYIPNIQSPFPQSLPVPPLAFGATANASGYEYDGYDGQISQFASNIQRDASGNIEFFIIDGFTYDGEGNIIGQMLGEDGTGALQLAKGASEITVIPFPGDCGKYYIISSIIDQIYYEKLPSLFVLDMNEKNQNYSGNDENCTYFGSFISQDGFPEPDGYGIPIASLAPGFIPPNPIPGSGKVSGMFHAATEERVDGSRLVFISSAHGIFVFRVDQANGFQNTGFIPYGSYDFNQEDVRSEMEVTLLSSGNYRIACAYKPGFGTQVGGMDVNQYLYTAELDPNGVLVAGTEKRFPFFTQSTGGLDTSCRVRGVEFSEDGNVMYVTHKTNSMQPDAFRYYDFLNPTPDLVPISVTQDFQYSMIERGFNNELYLAHQNGLYKLADASNPGSTLSLSLSFPLVANAEGEAVATSGHKMYMLQDQIDGMDYDAVFFSNLACCLDNKDYDVDLFEATTSSTWQDNASGSNPLLTGNGNIVYVKQELRIPAGITVTIQGMELRFAPGARLVVEHGVGGNGGRLILDNTTLTVDNGCDPNAMWLGVEVWGNQNSSQVSNQGKLELRNNSVIEHAWIGILVSARPANYSPDDLNCQLDPTFPTFTFQNQRNGGIVLATVGISTLRNNQRSVWFRPYMGGVGTSGPNNLSRFEETQFIWDDQIRTIPRDHAKLDEVKGVSFKGCYMANEIPSGANYYQTGNGIYGRDAQFYVNSLCNAIVPFGQPCPAASLVRSEFIDMDFGIISFNSNPLSFTCTDAIFTRNRHGIYVRGTDNEKVLSNDFEVRESDSYQTSGLSMYFSTGYHVEDNDFFDDVTNPLTPGTALTYGIVVNNSTEAANLIYRNRFKDLKIGGQTEGFNAVDINANNMPNHPQGLPFVMNGLLWKCNDYQSNIYDHDMTLFYSQGEGRINYNQGRATGGSSLIDQKMRAAGNKFSLDGESGEHDFYMGNNTQELTYAHLAAPRHTPDSYTTSNYNNGLLQNNPFDVNDVLWMGNFILDDAGACPSKLISKIPALAVAEMAALKEQISDLEELKDGGNTLGLLDLIATGSNGEIKDGLLAISPYLSDEVLLAFIAGNPPSGHLLQVIVANSPVSEQVAQALAAFNMPNGTANQIANVQQGTSGRTELDFEINYLKGEYELIYVERIRDALLDEDSTANLENLIVILKEENDRKRIESLMKIYTVIDDTTRYEESREDYLAVSNYCTDFLQVGDIRKETCFETSICEAIQNDQNIEGTLEYVRDNSPNKKVSNDAFCMLGMHDEYVEIPMFVTDNSAMAMMINNNTSEQSIDLHRSMYVNIYPNPSTGIVNFDYPDEKSGSMEITVINLEGKVMSEIKVEETNGERLDLNHLKKGFYLVRIKLDGVEMAPVKLEMF